MTEKRFEENWLWVQMQMNLKLKKAKNLVFNRAFKMVCKFCFLTFFKNP